jgi:hypothetical protein
MCGTFCKAGNSSASINRLNKLNDLPWFSPRFNPAVRSLDGVRWFYQEVAGLAESRAFRSYNSPGILPEP